MNKETRFFVRVSTKEKRQMSKAAREHKNLSAFLLASARDAIRYRRLIWQIKKYEREGLITLGALNVRES
jgi:hypothetical protein